jgi:hypothetical protein
VEGEVRAEQDQPSWRCLAVIKDPKKPRIKIACRNEEEHKTIKRLVEAKLPRGTRMLRDDLHPIKVDHVNRTAVLDETNNIRVGAAEAIGRENDVQIAKIGWLPLSDRQIYKAHGSMVIYLTRASDARRLLTDGYAYAGGESGKTAVFEHRDRPEQCYNYQRIGDGHRAYQCHNPQACANCAKEGHHHRDCREAVSKCVPFGGPTHHSAETAGSSTHLFMSSTFRMIQLNVRKRGEVHDSLMNDEEIQDAAVLAIQEPQARLIKGRLLTTPMGHHKWTKMVPRTFAEGRWAIRSMLWIRKDLEAEQVPIDSHDTTAALIRLPGRRVLVVSVYVQGQEPRALRETCERLRNMIVDARQGTGEVVEVVIAGDFNRHDQLWGGDDVSPVRQGEADDIIDLMSELSLCSMLARGTKTWQGGATNRPSTWFSPRRNWLHRWSSARCTRQITGQTTGPSRQS